jgi:transglutaminase-like putative cysteine protease
MVAAGFAVVTATVCAVLPMTTTYAPGRLPLLLAAAAVGGAATTAVLRAARAPRAPALLGSLVVMCGAMVALGLWLPRPAGSLLGATIQAMRHSGARILTSAVPVPSTLETVALPVCATWLAAATAVVLLTSARPAAAGVPPVILFVAGLVLVGPTSSPGYGYAAALVTALALLLGLLGGTGSGRIATFGATVLAALLAVLLGAATIWVGPALLASGGSQPPDPRAHVVPPYQDPEQINPLSLLSGWAAEPDLPLLEVRSDRATRLRWVTLPEFTGVTWLPAPSYRAAGAVLPIVSAAGGTPVHQEVSIAGLTGGWLPVPDGAREVRGVRVAIDVGSATLAAPDGLSPGLRYTVTAVPPQWPTDLLMSARLPADESYDDYRALPAGEPARLYELARLAAGTGSPYQQAKRLEGYLRRTYHLDPGAPGGNGYPSLDRFLFQPAYAGGGRGTSEHFATAFAVLARALGMPARVVVGFESGKPLGGDRYQVRAGDAIAWPEVYLEGAGWVPFEPTPSQSSVDESAVAPLAPPPTPAPTAVPTAPAGTDDSADDATDALAQPPGESTVATAWLGGLGAVVGVLVLGLAVLAGVRLRRGAARLRRGDPVDRVLGAWGELRDGLRLAGHAPAPALAVAEVASLAASSVDGGSPDRARALAAAVNAASFGGAALAPSDADRVVDDVRAFRRALRRRAAFGRRLTWWVDPRPIWWR